MDEIYAYMREKLTELQESREATVEIDCVEFMQLMKLVCYMRQIRKIVEDE